MSQNHPMIMYQSPDGLTKIEVKLEEQTVWLSQAQMVELFQSSKGNISEHIKNIFGDGELDEISVVREFRTTAADGKNYSVKHYNLELIIAVGYRVRSNRGVQFRKWATQILREYIVKGFAMNDDLLKEAGGGLYWKELLERIRDIRSSEKVFYRQILDVYATSVDYDPKTEESMRFFKMVQNKMHYAAHGHTAAEVIVERADHAKPFMGLTTFKGKHQPTQTDITVAKNYLNQNELNLLNRITTAYLEFAELQALRQTPMTMNDWAAKLDEFIRLSGSDVLNNAGTQSAKNAEAKALHEYEKYRALTADDLSPVEHHYLETLKTTQKQLEGKQKQQPRKTKQQDGEG